jgi:predicted DNA-binding transcriptional regulator AlpA
VFLSVEEECVRVGVSRNTLYQMLRCNEFPQTTHCQGARKLWAERDVVAWLASDGSRLERRVIPIHQGEVR